MFLFFFFKQKTAYEMRISDWSSDVCSSDLAAIDYRTQDWPTELRRLTDGRGVELITDPLGGSHWKKSYRALRSTGRLGMFGISGATESRLPGLLKLLPAAFGMPFFHPLSLMVRSEEHTSELQSIMRLSYA